MSVLHLWHSSGWRGGENQFRLLALHLPEEWKGHLGAPKNSELQRRMADILPVHPLSCGGFVDFRSIARARAIIANQGIRIVHGHDSHALTTALLARTGLGIPVIASRRSAYPIKSGWKYRACDHVIAVSTAAAEQLARAGVSSDAIAVIHDAVDLPMLDQAVSRRLDAGEEDAVVLCIAAFSREKDHRTLLKAWSEIERGGMNTVLYLAGTGPLEGELRGLAAELGLQRMRFLGWRDDVAALIRGADIVVSSSISEGLGSSLCEAQAAGKPVVAARAGGVPEAVEHQVGGLLVPPGDEKSLARALLLLIEDSGRREAMGQAARSRARRMFDPVEIAKQHAGIYQMVSNEHGGQASRGSVGK